MSEIMNNAFLAVSVLVCFALLFSGCSDEECVQSDVSGDSVDQLIAEAQNAMRDVPTSAWGAEKRRVEATIREIERDNFHSYDHIEKMRRREFERVHGE